MTYDAGMEIKEGVTLSTVLSRFAFCTVAVLS